MSSRRFTSAETSVQRPPLQSGDRSPNVRRSSRQSVKARTGRSPPSRTASTIDVTAPFTASGFRFLLLIEGKHQRAPVRREQVAGLFQKVMSIGAQKGAVFSTSWLQRGALKFATAHGIALVHCMRDDSPLIVVGGPDFGAEVEDRRPFLAEPISWRIFWDEQEYSAEHYIAPEIFTGRPF